MQRFRGFKGFLFLMVFLPVLVMGVQCVENKKYDIVIVGDTASAIGAAVTASSEKKSVCLISRVDKLAQMGGMITNGLVYADIGLPSGKTVNSYLKNKYKRLPYFQIPHLEGETLVSGLYGKFTKYIYENRGDYRRYTPTMARNFFKDKLEESINVQYMLGYVINNLSKTNEEINNITIFKLNEEDGSLNDKKTIQGEIFIDAMDTADLADLAGVDFKPFREEPSKYNEGFAGELYWNPTRLEFIYTNEYETPKLADSKEDDKIQAYSYFLAIKETDSIKRIEDTKIWKKINILDSCEIKNDYFNNFKNTKTVENNKGFESSIKGTYEVNVHPKGSDLQGENYFYHSSNWSERIKIENLYKKRALCFLQYWQDQGEKISLETNWYSNGMPDSMYIRESRRIEGLQNFTEKDATPYNLYNFRKNQEEGKGFKLEFREYKVDDKNVSFNKYNEYREKYSIGLSTYPMDSHATQAHPNYNHSLKETADESYHAGEGEFYLQGFSAVGIIPIGIIIPKAGAKNLLVTQAVSASHVGYSTLRMEPNRMGMGQAAAVIASLAIDSKTNNVHDYNMHDIQNKLENVYGIATKIKDEFKINEDECFSDINKSAYTEEICYLNMQGIVNGYNIEPYIGMYRPEEKVNRAEFTKIILLAKYLQSEIDDAKNQDFSDVVSGEWYANFVNFAKEKGIINGYADGTFKPAQNINFAEASKIVVNTLLGGARDLKEGEEWYTPFTEKLTEKNVQTYDAEKNITRGEMAQIIYEVLKATE